MELKLPFLSKVLEKVVLSQLLQFLEENASLEVFQSGFRALHSTESALLKVTNDLFMTVDRGNCAILVLLDLSAAFDTVDHAILISRLEQMVGLQGSVLNWVRSYLSDRTFQVEIGNSVSSTAPLSCGVPQGSILGPLLFSLYMLPLGPIIKKHGISYHLYADDTQLYFPLKLKNNYSLKPLLDCLCEIKSWMSQNFLMLNDNKTEVILFGPTHTTTSISASLGPLTCRTLRPLTTHPATA